MRKRLLHLLAYQFFCVAAVRGQSNPSVADSLYFEQFFNRYLAMIDQDSSNATDSLAIIGRIAEKKELSAVLSRYYLEKGALFIRQQRNDSALYCYLQAIAHAKKQNSARELGDAYLTTGNFYQYNGNTIAAAENYLQATRLLKISGRKRALVGLYVNLYIIMNRLQQKNVTLSNSLSALIADKINEQDLVKIINEANSEEVGFHFPDQTLLKEVGRDPIYVIFGNAKFAITSFENMGSYGSFRDVQRIPPGSIARIPDFPRNGSILREMDSRFIYVAKDGMLHQVDDFAVLETYGGWDGVYFVPPGSLAKFPKSPLNVTLQNRYNLFDFSQEFDILSDSIRVALNRNKWLSSELSRTVSERNLELQKRNTMLWVTIIGIAALLVIVLLLVRNFRQKQKINAQSMAAFKAEQVLQRKMALEAERTRIATDMHDDLGAGLSRIKFLSETIGIKQQQQQNVEEELGGIRKYSHEMIDKMGEIVWALNEKNDTLTDLLSYTRSYAVAYLSQHGIEPFVEMPETIAPLPISGEYRRNIYLAVKEALHNIVKHAKAKKVYLHFQSTRELSIGIRDDGIGFDPEGIRPFSNGLANMKKRIRDIGGTLSIESGPGTWIQFRAPLPS